MSQEKFHVGLRLALQLDNSYERIDLSVVGWVKNNFIIATGPKLREIELTSKNACVVRFVKDGIAYGFHTQMLTKVSAPIPLIFFQYPDDMSSLAFRKSTRLKTNIPAMIMGLKGKEGLITENARMVDLSETGCLLEVNAAKFNGNGPGGDFYLTFKLWEESIELDCTVRNVRLEQNQYMVGTAFKDVSAEQKEMIQNFHYMISVSNRDVPPHTDTSLIVMP